MLARELKGWTQREAVERLGGFDRSITAPALSQLETGRTRPAVDTLVSLCELYGCPPEFFLERPNDEEREGFFRSLKAASARDRKKFIARARLFRDFIRVVEEHILLPELRLASHDAEPDDVEAAEEIAARVRAEWRVDTGPIENVIRLMERHGIVVVRTKSFLREIDAFSVHYPARPIVVLGTGATVTSRSRFDAAHELAHLVMHRDEHAGTKAAEQHAHRFAAAFLMPADDIADELPRTMDVHHLMRLKVKWRVSMQALLLRAKTLGVMSPTRYVSAMKMVSARGWRTNEPGDDLLGPIEAPVMVHAALSRLADEGITVEQLCRQGSLPLDEIQGLLARTRDSRPRLEL